MDRTDPSATIRAGAVVVALLSAGCAAPTVAPNDAAVGLENGDDTAHTVRLRVTVENRTVVSRTARIRAGAERVLNGTTVPVTGTDRRYRVRVRLDGGATETAAFVADEFDALEVVVEPGGAVAVRRVDAA